MRLLRALLRQILVWWLPGIAMFAVLVAVFAFWLLGSQTGSRLLVGSAIQQLGGQVERIEGTVLLGLRVGHVNVEVAGTAIEADNLWLDVDWSDLSRRRLHVRDVSADRLKVALAADPAEPEPQPDDGEPFTQLDLPVALVLDRVALGRFELVRRGPDGDTALLPLEIGDLAAALQAGTAEVPGARLRIDGLRATHDDTRLHLQGEANVGKLAAPWPMVAQLALKGSATNRESPVCLGARLPGASSSRAARTEAGRIAGAQAALVAVGADVQRAALGPLQGDPALLAQSLDRLDGGAATGLCPLALNIAARGSLDALDVTLDGAGSGLTLDARAALLPLAAFPVQSANLNIKREDGSSLAAQLGLTPVPQTPGRDQLQARLQAHKLDLGSLLGDLIPPALLSADATVQAEIQDMRVLRQATVALNIAEESRWNRQPLSGRVSAEWATSERPEGAAAGAPAGDPAAGDPAAGAEPAAASSPAAKAPAAMPGLPAGASIPKFEVDLRLGPNRVRGDGALTDAAGRLKLEVLAPRLEAFWPDLPGGAEARFAVDGTMAAHRGTLDAKYTPPNPRAKVLGSAPADARLQFQGGWGEDNDRPGTAGWRGTLARVQAASAGFTAEIAGPVALAYVPGAQAPAPQWRVGAATLGLRFPDGQSLAIRHGASQGGTGQWQTAGGADNLVLRTSMLRQVLMALDPEAVARAEREAGRVNPDAPASQRRIAIDASWDLRYAGSLGGKVRLARRDGDLMVPGDPPIPLGLRALVLEATATPGAGGLSRLVANVNLQTEKMGGLTATANASLRGLALDPRQPIRANIDADMADLAWLSLFVGDALEIGGTLKANVQAQGTLAGKWNATGTIQGDKLRVVRIDDGVRLLDGTLRARLQDDRVILDSLRFPAVLRVMPAEWRTKEWVSTNKDAKGGYVEARGQWELSAARGNVRVQLHRFPALQRSDRYAMVSGNVDINAALPRIDITGDLTADAGWVSLEILQGVPSLDDDVRVVRAGDKKAAGGTPIQIGMNLKFDMGPRFYITGMGLDAGLLGSIQIQMQDGRLTGMGALRTRGGGIEAYGQKLRLRRGTLTFQGRIDNPLLDIEALRTGEQVEAGVRVSGTAQRPRIDLVSYPDVSDVEKLSWLVLGRGPDAGGGDTALLLSIGTALLGGGEPLYKQFGLDDVSIRTGAIGSSGSILPDRTVAGQVNRDSDSDLATQFLVASKNLSNGITLSIEQALAGSETVGRASYRLARGLSLDVKGGSVNGIALVYRWLIED
ncbi:translocation/assembly module TamB domain-containing protein [Pseudomonadota bacterium AL_CKDN230030165-1A_HGKHYDSX7]